MHPSPRMSAEEIQTALAQFTGTEQYFRHYTGRLVYTDGVRFLADAARCYWFLDLIASWQDRAREDSGLAEFQLWQLTVDTPTAVAICLRDTADEVFRQEIAYTDCPLREIKLYLEGNVLLLPSEH